MRTMAIIAILGTAGCSSGPVVIGEFVEGFDYVEFCESREGIPYVLENESQQVLLNAFANLTRGESLDSFAKSVPVPDMKTRNYRSTREGLRKHYEYWIWVLEGTCENGLGDNAGLLAIRVNAQDMIESAHYRHLDGEIEFYF